jgi:uncharacterized protein involved in response to NO
MLVNHGSWIMVICEQVVLFVHTYYTCIYKTLACTLQNVQPVGNLFHRSFCACVCCEALSVNNWHICDIIRRSYIVLYYIAMQWMCIQNCILATRPDHMQRNRFTSVHTFYMGAHAGGTECTEAEMHSRDEGTIKETSKKCARNELKWEQLAQKSVDIAALVQHRLALYLVDRPNQKVLRAGYQVYGLGLLFIWEFLFKHIHLKPNCMK